MQRLSGYKHPEKVDEAIRQVGEYLTQLKAEKDTLVHESTRLAMYGELPIPARGLQLPIEIWLPLTYPAAAPTIYAVINPTTIINPAGIVNKQGMVENDYINEWKPDYNLLDLLQTLIMSFNDTLPVFYLGRFNQPSKAKDNIEMVMENYPELKIDLINYESEEGNTSRELTLRGRVEIIQSSRRRFHVPLKIWLLYTFPRTAPLVYIDTNNIQMKLGLHVYRSGKVRQAYIQTWKYPESNLNELMKQLMEDFAIHEPIILPIQSNSSARTSAEQPQEPDYSIFPLPRSSPARRRETQPDIDEPDDYLTPISNRNEPMTMDGMDASPDRKANPPPTVHQTDMDASRDMKEVLAFVESSGLGETTTKRLTDNGFTSLRALLSLEEEDIKMLGLSMAQACLLRRTMRTLNEAPAAPENTQAAWQVRAFNQLLKPLMITEQELDIKEQIGKGEYGVVYRALLCRNNCPTPEEVALKTDSGNVDTFSEDLAQEIIRMRSFNHKNIVGLKALVILDNKPCMVLPFMSKGDLRKYIRNREQSFTVEDLLGMALDVASGMKYLSDQRYVHGDMAARNCLVDENYVVKVGDFGLSRQLPQSEYYKMDPTRRRPIRWMAPESLQDLICTIKSDVWGFGVLLWELWTRGQKPYPDIANSSIIPELIMDGRIMKCPQHAPEPVYEVMLECWQMDPNMRPCFATIIELLERLFNELQLPQTNESSVDREHLSSTGTGTQHSRTGDNLRARPPIPPKLYCGINN